MQIETLSQPAGALGVGLGGVVRHESFCGLGLLFITVNLGSPYPKKHLWRT